MDLTRSFSPDQFHRALESWQWLGVADKSPIFTSPFGDVFFRSDDGFWLLDTLEATLTRPWTGADELRAALGTTDGQDRFLLAGLAASAERQGIIPTAAQVYGFKIAPVLGGKIGIDNIETMTDSEISPPRMNQQLAFDQMARRIWPCLHFEWVNGGDRFQPHL